MWEINESFKDTTELSGSVGILLKSDKPLNPYHVTYPITWSGFINNESIEIVQPSDDSNYIADFEFTKYPQKDYYIYQGRIISLINKYYRKSMD